MRIHKSAHTQTHKRSYAKNAGGLFCHQYSFLVAGDDADVDDDDQDREVDVDDDDYYDDDVDDDDDIDDYYDDVDDREVGGE